MSFLAKLILGSATFNVLHADYEINQPTDAQNRPNGKPRGGVINLTLEASNKNDLAEWMLSPTMKKAGQLTFYRRDASSSMKTISFSDAFCINYREVFDATSPDPMKTIIRISAGELKINSAAVTNPWSSMAARAQEIGEKTGLSNIIGGGSGSYLNDIMNDPSVQEAGSMAQQGYNSGKQAYQTAGAAKNEATAAKNDAVAMEKDSAGKINEAEDSGKDAAHEITSFIP